VEGTAVAVDDDGGLVVRTGEGLRTFAAGDVVHVRPAAGGLA
jgi:BirA family biotin operon repressor/biotin-[acetyl-CoA-carboxylase] ligase